jgi:orotidine-5'-phosphate decarboxylase
VILDWQRQEDELGAKTAAKLLLGERWPCDAVVVCAYAGSGSVKPYITEANKEKKDVYVVLKTAGKSGSELQDLQTGGRTVYTAGADLVAKWGDPALERCGYSRVAAVCSASHSASIRDLRAKYPRMFLLVDGLEAGNANARNASYAFDKMGYGALVCANLLGAWLENPEGDAIEAVVGAAQKMKRNVTTYVTVL